MNAVTDRPVNAPFRLDERVQRRIEHILSGFHHHLCDKTHHTVLNDENCLPTAIRGDFGRQTWNHKADTYQSGFRERVKVISGGEQAGIGGKLDSQVVS